MYIAKITYIFVQSSIGKADKTYHEEREKLFTCDIIFSQSCNTDESVRCLFFFFGCLPGIKIFWLNWMEENYTKTMNWVTGITVTVVLLFKKCKHWLADNVVTGQIGIEQILTSPGLLLLHSSSWNRGNWKGKYSSVQQLVFNIYQ